MKSYMSRCFKQIIQALGPKTSSYSQTTVDNTTGKPMTILGTNYSRGSITRFIKDNNALIDVTIIVAPIFSVRSAQIKYQFYKNKPDQPFNLDIRDPEGCLLTLFS